MLTSLSQRLEDLEQALITNEVKKAQEILEELSFDFPETWQISLCQGYLSLNENDFNAAMYYFTTSVFQSNRNPLPMYMVGTTFLCETNVRQSQMVFADLLVSPSTLVEKHFQVRIASALLLLLGEDLLSPEYIKDVAIFVSNPPEVFKYESALIQAYCAFLQKEEFNTIHKIISSFVVVQPDLLSFLQAVYVKNKEEVATFISSKVSALMKSTPAQVKKLLEEAITKKAIIPPDTDNVGRRYVKIQINNFTL